MPVAVRVHRLASAVDDVIVERILEVTGCAGVPNSRAKLVSFSQNSRRSAASNWMRIGAQLGVLRAHQAAAP